MLVVKIEFWPGGREAKKKTIGTATIANDGSGTETEGNYCYEVKGKEGIPLRRGRGFLIGFRRKRENAWQLLKEVLEQVYP